MRKCNCPFCGKELIRLEPFNEGEYVFWCDDCDVDITVVRNKNDDFYADLLMEQQEQM